jgi:hypothetical protein
VALVRRIGSSRQHAKPTTPAIPIAHHALERAEARLAAGTFGASILSGRPTPDERLEAFPLAELTVQEAVQRDRNLGGRREPESTIGPSRDPFRVFDDPAAQDDGLVEDDGSDDEPGPQANLGVRTTL